MGVKFFGQFLIEHGEIDAGQLCEALDLMHAQNKPLGVVAVECGFLRETDADVINLRQRSTDRKFGELAIEMGLLTEAQLDKIVAAQRESRIYIGEALVHLDCIAGDRLPVLLDQFKIDQAPFESERHTLVKELDDNPIAHVVLDLLPKFCMRLAKVPVKMGAGAPSSDSPGYTFNVGVAMQGTPGLDVVLCSDEIFGRLLASSVSGISDDRLTGELVLDGIGEFLNVLCGNAVAALERDEFQTRLDPPRPTGQPEGGIVFDLAVGDGRASLILTPL